jgi:hypothetical protein
MSGHYNLKGTYENGDMASCLWCTSLLSPYQGHPLMQGMFAVGLRSPS